MEPVLYSERLTPSVSVGFALLLLGLGAGLIALPFGLTLALIIGLSTLLILISLSFALSPQIQLTRSALTVGKASIETTYLSKATSVAPVEAFKERGTNLDSRAFTLFRPGIKNLVKVEIADENDPTPYWLFSTRNPDILCKFLRQVS